MKPLNSTGTFKENVSISVLIANYNHAHFITEQLDAIIRQKDYISEIVIIDDCSTDNSVEIIKSYCHKYKFINFEENKKNLGATYSIKRAFNLSIGTHVTMTSSDDLILDNFFKKSMDAIRLKPSIGLCCSLPVEFLDSKIYNFTVNSSFKHLSSGFMQGSEVINKTKSNGFYIAGHTCIYSKIALKNIGLTDKFIPYAPTLWHEDFVINNVIAKRFGIYFIAEGLSAVRVHDSGEGQWSSGAHNWKVQRPVVISILSLLNNEYKDSFSFFKEAGLFKYIAGRYGIPGPILILFNKRNNLKILNLDIVFFSVKNFLIQILVSIKHYILR